MKTDVTYIYTLAHPHDEDYIRYVGKANDPAARYRQHIYHFQRTRKCHWIKSLLKRGLKPVMKVLAVVSQEQWEFWEMYWISQMKTWGFELYNGDNGGGLSFNSLTEASKRRRLAALKARKGLPGKVNIARFVRYAQYDELGNYIQTFDSAKTAAATVGVRFPGVIQAAQKGGRAGGFFWMRLGFAAEAVIAPPTISESIPGTKKPKYQDAELQRVAAVVQALTYNGSYSPEIREKMSISAKNRPQKAIEQLSMYDGSFLKAWKSTSEASAELGISMSSIFAVCHSRVNHAGGYFWRWAGSQSIPPSVEGRMTPFSAFTQAGEFVGTWMSEKQGAEALGINLRNINLGLKGKAKTTGGYILAFNTPAPAACVS